MEKRSFHSENAISVSGSVYSHLFKHMINLQEDGNSEKIEKRSFHSENAVSVSVYSHLFKRNINLQE